MSPIKVFLTVFVLGVAIALILETLKKRKKLKATVAAATEYLSANEAMTTQTGKYRVQEAFKASTPKAQAAAETQQAKRADADAEKLPDPFQIDVNTPNH